MQCITYRVNDLLCEDVRLEDIASECGTPSYVYSGSEILDRYTGLCDALRSMPYLVCYAVKTNSNLGVLGMLARAGAGFDIVSGGELARLLRVGVAPERIVFAGVGKTQDEMRAALEAGIGMFNVESLPEAELLSKIATELGRTATVALRVNPDLEAGGHRYIATGTPDEKFGIPSQAVPEVFAALAGLPGLEPRGLHCHIGSQILESAIHGRVARHLADLTGALRGRGFVIDTLNVGGGLGIRYDHESPPQIEAFASAIAAPLAPLGVRILVEPGRYLVGNAGVLLSRVLYRKETAHKVFLVVDAAMNDLVRPSLYGAHHAILPVRQDPDRPVEPVDVVGPICESGDFLARGRPLPRMDPGDLLAVLSAGAYGFTMSSNYNTRPRAAEVLVRGHEYRIVRRREDFDDLVRGESDWQRASDQEDR